jgi:hypothetical protein
MMATPSCLVSALKGMAMSSPGGQTLDEACVRFVDWLDRKVIAAGRGDGHDRLDVAPASTFWLGRLATEDEVRVNAVSDRSERLDPCAIGVRIRPAKGPSWSMSVTVRARAWLRDDKAKDWWRSEPVEEVVTILVGADGGDYGRKQLEDAFAAVGAPGLSAEVRVEVEEWHHTTELVIELVNTSPLKAPGLSDTHLFETEIEVAGVETQPFQLESLPDSFRYVRDVPAYGINVGVEATAAGAFRTTDTVTVQTYRSGYWNSDHPRPDLTFATLASDPLPHLSVLVEALSAYDEQNWSSSVLDRRAVADGWTPAMRQEATVAAQEVFAELVRLRTGLEILRRNAEILRAFQLMNKAIGLSAQDKYTSWRPFQVGFLLSALPFLEDPGRESDVVDTVWFATGGGKTETYLGLLLIAAFLDRLTGKSVGVTAWSRFPLRLLSLQQTQRFADALAAAETVRQEEKVPGSRFSLGFLVGQAGTPNRVVPANKAKGDEITPDSPGMPDSYQVLLRCPFCRSEKLTMKFDRRTWQLEHRCTNTACPWKGALPIHVVDQEVFRFLPTVVVGTLDKAASISMQQAMRGLVGAPWGLCTEPWHGFTYAPRSGSRLGCLVPDCPASSLKPLDMDPKRFGPSLRLQDELHLLRDSLGAVDSHYESLLDYLQMELTSTQPKIVASSATLTGYERQVDVLYSRTGRVFPQPGPRAGESFWTLPAPDPLRRFVAVAPRGVTLDHVNDRTVDTLQHCVRRLKDDPAIVCAEANIDPQHVDRLVSLYGTNVVYGTSLYDVEAAERSLGNNNTVDGINSVQLTGQTDFDDVRAILDRLEKPEDDFAERIHVVAASSMLSHGVDVNRLNTMVMLGLPLTTAEFIQTTARIGRRYPGLAYVLHKIARERDAQTFRHFDPYVRQGDRFVDAIPITRRSRRVLDLTIPGVMGALRLMLWERAGRQSLTTLANLRAYVRDSGKTAADESAEITHLLGFEGEEDSLHREQILQWLTDWFADLNDPAQKGWPNDLGDRPPMLSLRDVEASAPIYEI